MTDLNHVVSQFSISGTQTITPLGNGLINDTYIVRTSGDTPDYVLQRINHHIFTDVEGLQNNIQAVTRHIRRKLEQAGADDIDRRVLTFIPLSGSDKTYYFDGENYWRVMLFIPDADTFDVIPNIPVLPDRLSVSFRQCWWIYPTRWLNRYPISTTWNSVSGSSARP